SLSVERPRHRPAPLPPLHGQVPATTPCHRKTATAAVQLLHHHRAPTHRHLPPGAEDIPATGLQTRPTPPPHPPDPPAAVGEQAAHPGPAPRSIPPPPHRPASRHLAHPARPKEEPVHRLNRLTPISKTNAAKTWKAGALARQFANPQLQLHRQSALIFSNCGRTHSCVQLLRESRELSALQRRGWRWRFARPCGQAPPVCADRQSSR